MSSPRPFVRRVLVNTAATGLSNVWSIAVTLVALPVILSGLGSEAFGLYVIIQTFSVFNGWGALVDLGVGTAGTRSIAGLASVDDREGCDRIATAVLVLTLLFTAVAAGLLVVLTPGVLVGAFHVSEELRAEFTTAISLFALQLLVDQVTKSAERVLEGLGRIDISRLIDSVRRTAAAAVAAVVAQTTGSLASVGAAMLVVAVPVALVALLVLRAHVRPRAFRRGEVVELMGYAVRIGALRPLGTMHRMMDRVIVGFVLGPEAVTVVEIATQVQNGADAFLSASSYAVMPSSSWLDARQDETTKRRLLEIGTKYSMIVTVPLVIGPAFLAPDLLDVWVGSDGDEAAGVVAVAMLYVLLTAPAQVSGEMLIGTGRAGVVFRGAGFALLANLAATLLLVPEVGTVGAFLGSLVGAPFILYHVLRGSTLEVGWDVRTLASRSIVPVVVPALLLAATVGVLGLAVTSPIVALGLCGLVGGAVYAAAVWRFAVTREEVQSIVASLRSRRHDDEADSAESVPEEPQMASRRRR